MFPKPRQDLAPNTVEFERLPFVKAIGFREYDARWLYPEEINLPGLEAVGLGLATLMRERNVVGVRSVTSKRSSAPVSRSDVIAVVACAVTSSRLSTLTGNSP